MFLFHDQQLQELPGYRVVAAAQGGEGVQQQQQQQQQGATPAQQLFR